MEFLFSLLDSNELLFQNKMQDFSETCTQRWLLRVKWFQILPVVTVPTTTKAAPHSQCNHRSFAVDNNKQWLTGAFRNILVCIKTSHRKQTNVFLAGIIDQPQQKISPYLLLCHVHAEQVVPLNIFHLIWAYPMSANITKSPPEENTVRDWISSWFIT